MTAPETTAPAAPEQAPPEPSDWPLAEEALAAMPEGKRDLYAPLDIPPEPKWEPWPEYAACRAYSADEQAAEMRRWWNGLRERMYSGMRGPSGWLTGNAPDPAEREHDGTWPPPAPPGSVIVSAEDVIAAVYPDDRLDDLARAVATSPETAGSLIKDYIAETAGPPLAVAPVPEPEDDAAAAAVKHAADEALRRAGVKQEDLDALAQPGDGRDATTEMTAVIERPQEQQ